MITKDDLYELLPVVTRLRDAEVGSPLERLIGVLAREADVLDRDIERLYDNWFIETCEAWLVPYIGDLIGVRPLFPVGPGTASGRAYVANTIGYRRRKGTVGVLEQLAFDVTGWGARAVEFFELLGTTQYLNHLRPENVGTPDFRDGNGLDLLGGPFERIAHTAEVRRIPTRRGRYDIPNVGIFLWRLGSYPLERATAERIGAKIDGTWMFSPLGLDMPLFNRPEADRGIVDLAGETDVPAPLRRRAVRGAPDHYLAGTRPVLEVFTSAAATGPLQPVAPEKLVVADLRLWQRPADPGTVGLDPVLGRLTFPAGEEPERVEASYAYGFSHDIGGGPYDRRLPTPAGWHRRVGRASPADPAADFDSLADAVAAWNAEPAGTVGTITILDSRTYDESAASPIHVGIPAESRLAIVAAERMRPHVRADLEVVGTAAATDVPGELSIDGLLLEGSVVALAGNLGRLGIADATMVPGSGAVQAAAAAGPGDGNAELAVELERAICGDISLADTVPTLVVRDAIVEGALDAPGAEVEIDRVTAGGDVRVRLLRAGNSIFGGAVVASRRQEGCVRFCFLPRNPATVTPRRYRCQPDLALKAAAGATARASIVARVVPTFTSTAYGDPGYRQLGTGCPPEISTGAEDGSEMGAFSTLKQPQREANLRTALDEYLRFGLEAGAVYVT